MGGYTCRLLYLALLLFFTCTFNAAGEDSSAFEWKVGDIWLIKAVYHSDLDEDKWSPPLLWEYKVAGLTLHENENCYLVEVRQYNRGKEPCARLLYRQSGRSLASVEIIKTRRNIKTSQVINYNKGVPVQTEQSLIPFDTPVFPLVPGLSVDYRVRKKVTESLYASKRIKQTVSRAGRMDDNLIGLEIDADLIEVKCISENGSTFFTQYWDTNRPWPLYGENSNMKYWLVKD